MRDRLKIELGMKEAIFFWYVCGEVGGDYHGSRGIFSETENSFRSKIGEYIQQRFSSVQVLDELHEIIELNAKAQGIWFGDLNRDISYVQIIAALEKKGYTLNEKI